MNKHRKSALKQLRLIVQISGVVLLSLCIASVVLWLSGLTIPLLFSLALLIVAGLVPFVLRRLGDLEDNIEYEQKAAEQSRQTLITYVRVLSHEVRNPIAGIQSRLNNLQGLLNTPEQLREVSRIQHSAQVANDVLQNIVTMNKGEAPVVAETRNTNVRETIESCFRIVRFSNARGLELIYQVDDSVPEQVVCDSLRLSQILLNLLGNAIKYTEKGRVELDVRSFKEEGLLITQFVITDEGIGIAADSIERLFEPYAQGDTKPVSGFSSSGLGLSLVKQLVEEMDGHIEVESRLNIGSSFIVRLPLEVASAESNRQPMLASIPNERGSEQPRVLVAEDNEINQLVAQRMLDKLGCAVTLAENGLVAYELHEEQSFDLILMDLQMPVMDGLSATQRIMEADRPAPHIVAMTANVLEEERQRCIEAGMSDFLSKPVKIDNLRNCLRKHRLL